ncbi:MAG: hypothetical protein H0V66_10890 [Bdellovibrionales bacterium]|nr:hypothetical protein [Bdellovibrionales bacterium]
MDNFWFNFALEIGFFSFLGVLYYFYQKRKLIRYEENKTPMVMTFILQTCLSEKLDQPQPELDQVIEAVDDFLNQKSASPPLALLKNFVQTPACSPELKHAILEGLKELE